MLSMIQAYECGFADGLRRFEPDAAISRIIRRDDATTAVYFQGWNEGADLAADLDAAELVIFHA